MISALDALTRSPRARRRRQPPRAVIDGVVISAKLAGIQAVIDAAARAGAARQVELIHKAIAELSVVAELAAKVEVAHGQ